MDEPAAVRLFARQFVVAAFSGTLLLLASACGRVGFDLLTLSAAPDPSGEGDAGTSAPDPAPASGQVQEPSRPAEPPTAPSDLGPSSADPATDGGAAVPPPGGSDTEDAGGEGVVTPPPATSDGGSVAPPSGDAGAAEAPGTTEAPEPAPAPDRTPDSGVVAGAADGGPSSAGSGGAPGSEDVGGPVASAGSAGATAAAGAPPIAAVPDLGDGYWLLTAADPDSVWDGSTLTVTAASSQPDGTIALDLRLDWFEDAGTFGMLLGGEETDSGSFDPVTGLLSFDQTGGWESATLDHYEATYDVASDRLINGFWDTGSAGTWSGVRRLAGSLLAAPSVQVTSLQAGATPSSIVDGAMMTQWSSANNRSVGEIVTLTLAAPSRLRGLRLLAVPAGNSGVPAALRVTAYDAQGSQVFTTDSVVPAEGMWREVGFDTIDVASEVRVEITQVEPSGANRVVINGLELFGIP